MLRRGVASRVRKRDAMRSRASTSSALRAGSSASFEIVSERRARRRGGRSARGSSSARPRRAVARAAARRSGSRSAPRPCAGCRRRRRARARSARVVSRRMRPTSTSSIPAACSGRREVVEADARRGAEQLAGVARARAAPRVSTQTASAWPTSTGTRTHVRAGSAARAAPGSCASRRGASTPRRTPRRRSPSPCARSCSSVARRAQPLHRLRAGARRRLVRRDAHAREAGGVVQRLEHARERDRAAVRVRRRCRRARARARRSPRARRAGRRPRAGRPTTCRRRPRRRATACGTSSRDARGADREEEDVERRRARAPPASPPRRCVPSSSVPAERADAKSAHVVVAALAEQRRA